MRVECLSRKEVIRFCVQEIGRLVLGGKHKYFHFNEKQDREMHIHIQGQGVCRWDVGRTCASFFFQNAFYFLENKENNHQLRKSTLEF